MRVLTFQTEDVIHAVLEEGSYHADPTLARERRNYELDINQLEGYDPIWCFAPVDPTKPFKTENFINGELFHRYKCEMSLQGNLSQFPMIELEVPDEMLKLGLTHNAYMGAKVFSTIEIDMLKAVYRLSFDEHWYYPKVLVAKLYAEDALFPNGLDCRKLNKDEEEEG